MKTLEYLVKLELDREGYYYDRSILTAAADYIELHNENNVLDDFWTPADWVTYTKDNYPEKLIKKRDLYNKICYYLKSQRDLCREQAGCDPEYYDYEQGMDCEDYVDKCSDYAADISLDDVFNFLLEYYTRREGPV